MLLRHRRRLELAGSREKEGELGKMYGKRIYRPWHLHFKENGEAIVDFGALLRKARPWLLNLDASSGEEGK
jgi:hypothetical protein